MSNHETKKFPLGQTSDWGGGVAPLPRFRTAPAADNQSSLLALALSARNEKIGS